MLGAMHLARIGVGVRQAAPGRPRRCSRSSPTSVVRTLRRERAGDRRGGSGLAALGGDPLGLLEPALDQIEPRAPEPRVGEVDADDLPELLGGIEPPARSSSR